jgi:1,4-dihydroxy-6-naphthoate synthase
MSWSASDDSSPGSKERAVQLSLGFSPCPNDTFIFHALVHGQTDLSACTLREELHDVETLNQLAFNQVLDVTKLSFYAWLMVRENYRLLQSGAALGFGCGPLVISRKPLTHADMAACRVVLPGQWTTAHLLFRLWAPDAQQRRFVTYDRIFEALDTGAADCGVIIHESRFTFEQAGFRPVIDLGAWWEARTALPIPLGGIAVHRRVPQAVATQLETAVRQSIQLARQNPQACYAYIRRHAQEMQPDVQQAHIDTYVNDFSLGLGAVGLKAIAALEQEALRAGLLAP